MGITVSRSLGGSAGDARLRLDDAVRWSLLSVECLAHLSLSQSSLSDNLYDLVRLDQHARVMSLTRCREQYRFLPEFDVDTYDLVITHEGSAADFAVTLRAYSNDKISFAAGPPPLPYACEVSMASPLSHDPSLTLSLQIRGGWSTSTAGGNHTCYTFLNNPQYSLKLSPPPGSSTRTAELHVVAETDKDSPINARVVFGKGERIDRCVLPVQDGRIRANRLQTCRMEDRDRLAGDASYSYGRSFCSGARVTGACNVRCSRSLIRLTPRACSRLVHSRRLVFPAATSRRLFRLRQVKPHRRALAYPAGRRGNVCSASEGLLDTRRGRRLEGCPAQPEVHAAT